MKHYHTTQMEAVSSLCLDTYCMVSYLLANSRIKASQGFPLRWKILAVAGNLGSGGMNHVQE